jgi:Reverse transcriptase (RNA-dependent DNA polymerase)
LSYTKTTIKTIVFKITSKFLFSRLYTKLILVFLRANEIEWQLKFRVKSTKHSNQSQNPRSFVFGKIYKFNTKPGPSIPSSISNESDLFAFRTVPFSDVKRVIRLIKSNAVDLDGIALKSVKLFLPLILSPLAHLLNESIASKTFPNAWKRSKIVPIAKTKDPGWLKDYRPISILPALSKALENIMKDQIVAFCNEKGLFNRFQSGFRPGHSTTTALLKITDDISMEMDRIFVTILELLELL